MRNVIYAMLLFAASPATAQPITAPHACTVTIARAPDDVRAVVEAWVRSEPQCNVALEVRIVPTEGGLYLLAQDERGGVRERVVPDAQSAGVLVASWIADDNAPQPPPPPPVAAAPSLEPAPAPVYVNESVSPPGLSPISASVTATPAPVVRSKWLTAGLMIPTSNGVEPGVRAEIDLWRRGAWRIGAAGSIGQSVTDLYSSTGWGDVRTTDMKAMAYLSRTSSFGRWHLRPSIGAGVMYSDGAAQLDNYSQYYALDGTFATVEASLMLSREIGKRWAAYTGPLATVVSQTFETTSYSSSYPMSIARSDIDIVLFTGVQRRL